MIAADLVTVLFVFLLVMTAACVLARYNGLALLGGWLLVLLAALLQAPADDPLAWAIASSLLLVTTAVWAGPRMAGRPKDERR